MKRIVYFCLGCIFLVVGVLGVILPILPGTINLILAAGFFAKSSPRLEAWMLNHPHLGPPICRWRQEGSISKKHKGIAVGTLWFGIIYTCIMAPWYVGIGAAVCAVWVSWYILSRPTAAASGTVGSPDKNPVDAC